MASKAPRVARYWLKDNSMDYMFPRLTKEQFRERQSMWKVGDVALNISAVTIGAQGILSYFWPQYFDVNIPFINFLGFEYFPRALYRAVRVGDESDL